MRALLTEAGATAVGGSFLGALLGNVFSQPAVQGVVGAIVVAVVIALGKRITLELTYRWRPHNAPAPAELEEVETMRRELALARAQLAARASGVQPRADLPAHVERDGTTGGG